MNPKTPSHEIFVNSNGTTSLREIASGEVMHSCVGPYEETTLLYVEQSKLKERLQIGSTPLVLYDVGLGAGTNALGALQCLRELGPKASRGIDLISFETDASGFELALEHKDRFPFFDGMDEACRTLLRENEWQDEKINWKLKRGHFSEYLKNCPAPELIFFDFYSPNVVPELWTASMFEEIYAHCTHTTLYTYSASTRVRSALLLAGFYVGYGRKTGAKIETTVASTHLEELERPLDARWLERFARSHAAAPYGWAEARTEEARAKVLEHPQFKR